MVAGIITDFTDWLDRISSHWWFLLVILVVAYLDSVIPVVPSETCVIIGGVAASHRHAEHLRRHRRAARSAPSWATTRRTSSGFAPANGFGAVPNESRSSPPSWRGRRARSMQRGGLLLITARFIPGGRTVLTLSCGITRQKRAWFMRWVALATMIWATYSALLGSIGGEAFEDDHTKAFMFAFGLAIGTNIVIEIVRHYWKKRREAAATAAATRAEHAMQRHLAQLNIATLRHPLDDPRIADFVDGAADSSTVPASSRRASCGGSSPTPGTPPTSRSSTIR